jgi:hypothetical protein
MYSTVDYTYHFGMQRFSVFDHFILSGGLYDTAVTKLAAIHDVDNTSEHEPLALCIAVFRKRLALTARQFIVRPAWAKATAENILSTHANFYGKIYAQLIFRMLLDSVRI